MPEGTIEEVQENPIDVITIRISNELGMSPEEFKRIVNLPELKAFPGNVCLICAAQAVKEAGNNVNFDDVFDNLENHRFLINHLRTETQPGHSINKIEDSEGNLLFKINEIYRLVCDVDSDKELASPDYIQAQRLKTTQRHAADIQSTFGGGGGVARGSREASTALAEKSIQNALKKLGEEKGQKYYDVRSAQALLTEYGIVKGALHNVIRTAKARNEDKEDWIVELFPALSRSGRGMNAYSQEYINYILSRGYLKMPEGWVAVKNYVVNEKGIENNRYSIIFRKLTSGGFLYKKITANNILVAPPEEIDKVLRFLGDI